MIWYRNGKKKEMRNIHMPKRRSPKNATLNHALEKSENKKNLPSST